MCYYISYEIVIDPSIFKGFTHIIFKCNFKILVIKMSSQNKSLENGSFKPKKLNE